jgi:hypothetical protein
MLGVVMPGGDQEPDEVAADRVEDVTRDLDAARALETGTLADEVLGAVRPEGVVDVPDPLVHLPKEGALLDLANRTLSSDGG